MDGSQVFCAILLSILLSIFLKSLFIPKKTQRVEIRRKSTVLLDVPKPAPKLPELHDLQELRHLSISELQTFNTQFTKVTDRYWREIFRRQNDAHHPDHINVAHLLEANIITVLDEHLPRGAIQELTVVGLIKKPFRKCEVMRYLKERLSTSPNVELSLKDDRLRITSTSAGD